MGRPLMWTRFPRWRLRQGSTHTSLSFHLPYSYSTSTLLLSPHHGHSGLLLLRSCTVTGELTTLLPPHGRIASGPPRARTRRQALDDRTKSRHLGRQHCLPLYRAPAAAAAAAAADRTMFLHAPGERASLCDATTVGCVSSVHTYSTVTLAARPMMTMGEMHGGRELGRVQEGKHTDNAQTAHETTR